MALFVFLFFLVLIAYGLLIGYYRRGWNNLPEYQGNGEATTSCAVIVAARNEEHNTPRLMESLRNLNYPKHLLEFFVVDDHSEDQTASLVDADFARLVRLPEGETGKKKAIAAGIAMAKGELIVTTDADCELPPQWLNVLSSFYRETGARCIAAPVRMHAGKSWTGIFQSLDFLTMQGITGAAIFTRFHSMANGANLAYPRAEFYEVGGFNGIDHLPSGDDMLLMEKIAGRYPDRIHYLKSKNAIVTTPAEPGLKSFFQQRIRWASKSTSYQDKKLKYILLLTYGLNLFFVAGLIFAFFQPAFAVFLLLFFIAKILIEFPFVNSVASFFSQRSLMKYFILLQPVHILYIVAAGFLGKFAGYSWKNRKIDR